MATNSDAENHHKQLQRHCRVCARVIVESEYKYSCNDNINLLQKCGIHVGNDKSHIHPHAFCRACRAKAMRFSDGKQVQCSLQCHQWTEHTESGCDVCNLFRNLTKGGRRHKQGKKAGRPFNGSSQSIANGILRNASLSWKSAISLSPSRFLPSTSVPLDDLTCKMCACIVDRPVETPCGKLVCAVCISASISESDLASFNCPSCNTFHTITNSSYTKVPVVVTKVLGDLLISCDKSSCSQIVALKNLKAHIDSGCRLALPTFSPSKMTVAQITSRPLTSPPTRAETNVATNIVKRLLSSSPPEFEPGPSVFNKIVRLPTGGQVSMLECYLQFTMKMDIIIINK